MRFVFMGPPGAGKGTQAKAVAAHYGIPHVSSGDIFRAEIEEDTPLGRRLRSYLEAGDLVPDDVTTEAVVGRLARDDCASGWLLDGFPRTEGQARVLDETLRATGRKLDAVVCLEVDPETIVRRMRGRQGCPRCGRSYHVELVPPRVEGKCDACGAALAARGDDKPETLRRRLGVYQEQTAPLEAYYARQGLLVLVSGEGAPDEVRARIFEQLRAVQDG